MSIFDPNLFTASRYRCPGEHRTPYDPAHFLASRAFRDIKSLYLIENTISPIPSLHKVHIGRDVLKIQRTFGLVDLIQETVWNGYYQKYAFELYGRNPKRSFCGYLIQGETRNDISNFTRREYEHSIVDFENKETRKVCFDFGLSHHTRIIKGVKFSKSIDCAVLPQLIIRSVTVTCRRIYLGPDKLQNIFGSSGDVSGILSCRSIINDNFSYNGRKSARSAVSSSNVVVSGREPKGACAVSTLRQNNNVRRSKCYSETTTQVPTLIYGRITAGVLKPNFGGTGRIV